MGKRNQLHNDPDGENILRCINGDVDAFEKLVIKYERKMFNICLRIVGDYNDAAEVVQDAFMSAYKSLKNFKGDAKFSTWLYTIAVNLSRNRIKQVKSRIIREGISMDDPVETDKGDMKVEYASSEISVHEKLERREVADTVQDCIKSIDDEFREIIVLRDIQGFSYDEIANMLSLAAGTVKSRLHRAREAVKNCLKRQLGESLHEL